MRGGPGCVPGCRGRRRRLLPWRRWQRQRRGPAAGAGCRAGRAGTGRAAGKTGTPADHSASWLPGSTAATGIATHTAATGKRENHLVSSIISVDK